ncbi:hydrogenase iron-sulfur subunit [Haladaptatus sp. NG-SE-30]
MKTGAFVCSCGETSEFDLEQVREGVNDVDVVASSSLLCRDGISSMGRVIDEYELNQIIITAPDSGCRGRFRQLASDAGIHPEAVVFVDHREMAAWVHDDAAATAKTARLVNATYAGLQAESASRTVSRETGDAIVVVGDAETAAALADTATVSLVADGNEYADADIDLDDVTIERGRVVDVDGQYGDFELRIHARVTEDCISCMKCVHDGPDGMITRSPVDIDPDAADGEWVDCCPTDAIELDGVERTITADQVVFPDGGPQSHGGRIGFYTGPVDASTIASVERLLGGTVKPDHLDIDMSVCASGASSQQGCNACVDACPHDAVERPRIDEVEFDKIACQDCGACTSACPTGAVQLREPSNRRLAREVEAVLEPPETGGWLFGGDDPIPTQVVAFVCAERAERALREYGRRAAKGDDIEYPPILPVKVNCADTVGEPHVMHALAAGADGVVLLGCADDCLHSGSDPKAELVERMNTATTDLGLGDRVTFLSPSLDDTDEFVSSLSAFVDDLELSPVPAGDYEADGVLSTDAERPNPAFDSHGWTLESVRAIGEHVEPSRDVIRGLKDFGWMEVSDACVLTPTCSNLCPTDAIRRPPEEGVLQFNHERCVNCGLCEEGCPETAITMQDGLDLSLLPENREGDDPAWHTVFEGEMQECVRCGTPFASKATAEKIEAEVGDQVAGLAPDSEHSVFEYCGDCRAKMVFQG